MRTRTLGPSGIEASVVGLGTWAIGGWMWGGTEQHDAITAIRAALDSGVTLIDTAPVYGFGRSEELIGKAITGRRDQVVLATKCGLRWDDKRGELQFRSSEKGVVKEGGKYEVHRFAGPDSIRIEVERSLQRLQTDRIDLYQTHWQDATTPHEDTMGALTKLKTEGKIRAIGVSNAEPQNLEGYEKVAPLDSAQERYNMLDRSKDAAMIPACRQRGMAVLAYGPMAYGLLTGKIGPDDTFAEGDHRHLKPMFSRANREIVMKILDALRPIAGDHNATLGQLAVAWVLHRPGLTHALVGARNADQAKQNAKAADIELSESTMHRIQEILESHPLE